MEVKAADIAEVKDDDATHVRVVCGNFWGKAGPVDGIAADPIYLDVSVSPGKRKTLPVDTTRHAFAYVFAGTGKFCNASGPLAVPTETIKWADTTPPVEADNRSLVRFDRGDEVTVQARGRWNPVSPGLCKAIGRAGGVVRPDRDEHAGATAAGIHGTPRGNLPEREGAQLGIIVSGRGR
jgi:hypothetical protein